MDWTEERVAQLKLLWGQGMSASQVSRQLGGVSRNAVIGKVHRMGLNGRDRPAAPRALGGLAPNRAKSRSHGPGVVSIGARAPQSHAPRRRPSVDLPPTASILELSEDACRWPTGDPQHDDFGFCGRHRSGPGAYCPDHAPLAFRRPSEAQADALLAHARRRVATRGFATRLDRR
jgi:GcrA cell cycle regulator